MPGSYGVYGPQLGGSATALLRVESTAADGVVVKSDAASDLAALTLSGACDRRLAGVGNAVHAGTLQNLRTSARERHEPIVSSCLCFPPSSPFCFSLWISRTFIYLIKHSVVGLYASGACYTRVLVCNLKHYVILRPTTTTHHQPSKLELSSASGRYD